MSAWNDFNSADDQQPFDVIPKGQLVKVRMTIRPGGFDDATQGWSGGYATRNDSTGSVYLNAEFVVLNGPYAKRKVWSLIGLHSVRGPDWANMGRSFIKSILNSARGLQPQDISPPAQQARYIHDFSELNGIEFVAKIDREKDQYGDDKNVIRTAITPDHSQYAAVMGNAPATSTPAASPLSSSSPSPSAPSSPPAAPTQRPSWAQ